MDDFSLDQLLAHQLFVSERYKSIRTPALSPQEKQPVLLSLQQTALYYVVTNIEKYSPDVLALLPLHLRKKLLHLLPPGDILQLEQTKVCDGIDMESNEVWKTLCEQFDLQAQVEPWQYYGTETDILSIISGPMHRKSYKDVSRLGMFGPLPRPAPFKHTSSKVNLITCITTFLLHMLPFRIEPQHAPIKYLKGDDKQEFNNYYMLFVQLLFCNRFVEQAKLVRNTFPSPNTSVRLYNNRIVHCLTVSQWIEILIEKWHVQPHVVCMNFQQLSLDVVSMMGDFNGTLLRFLKDVNVVELFFFTKPLSSTERKELESKYLMWLLDILAALNQLERISICQPYKIPRSGCIVIQPPDTHIYDDHVVNEFVKKLLFQGKESQQDNNYTRNLNGLLCHLKHVSIYAFYTGIELSTLCSLLALSQCQSTIESISLTGCVVVKRDLEKSSHEKMLKALQKHYTQHISSKCVSITLKSVHNIPVSLFLWLMQKFLSSPSNLSQILSITDCFIDFSILPSEKWLKHIPLPLLHDDSKKCLHLNLSNATITNANFTTKSLKVLSQLPPVVLDNLQIDHLTHWSYQVQPGEFFKALILNPKHRIKCLKIDIPGRLNVTRPGMTLIENVQLECLFMLAQMCPETTVSIIVKVFIDKTKSVLQWLYNRWKKVSRNLKIDELSIVVYSQRSDQTVVAIDDVKHPIDSIASKVEVTEVLCDDSFLYYL